jgi:hypothetical protein
MNYVALAREALSEHQRFAPHRSTTETTKTSEPLERVLNGRAIELWSDSPGERFWLVADEADAVRLGEPRGTVYTAAEARRVIEVRDPADVAEIHEWKRRFDGVFRVGEK